MDRGKLDSLVDALDVFQIPSLTGGGVTNGTGMKEIYGLLFLRCFFGFGCTGVVKRCIGTLG